MKKTILIVGVISALGLILSMGWTADKYKAEPDGTISTILDEETAGTQANTLYIRIQQNQALIEKLTIENLALQAELDQLTVAMNQAKQNKP